VPTIASISDVTNGSKSPSKVPAYLHPDSQFDDRATGRTDGLNSSLPTDRSPSVEFKRNEKPGFQALRFLNLELLQHYKCEPGC